MVKVGRDGMVKGRERGGVGKGGRLTVGEGKG